ncbi:hypothetical protein [Desulfovibrio sp. MES5]|uniref:hypothetical protein n=1 Tax=Desulfovibrio sp. MES5 TaxID=1899016 RepID=UPI0025C53A58|nr:hypothetical protein [Desulfovibrio sp. MES5]
MRVIPRIITIIILALAAGPVLTVSLDGPQAKGQNITAYESGQAQTARTGASVGQGPNISAKYLKQARQYRDQGRYELARQSYTQALSTCRSAEDLAVIEKELGGIELLLRTMR